MSILSRSIYTIFFTVGSRNSTEISNFKNKKMMTNELSSFDEFNGISSCLDNTIRFLSQQSKKMKTPIRFLSQLSKKWKLPREQIFANICSLGRKCSTSVTMLTSEKLISTPDREKTTFLYVLNRGQLKFVTLVDNCHHYVLVGYYLYLGEWS
jgi:hypothetical protein